MRYINDKNPNVRVLVKRGPDLPKGENQSARQDKFIEFRYGMAESDDPETMAFLDAYAGCRRESDKPPVKGYVTEADMRATVDKEVERRLAELTAIKPKLEGGPYVCPECEKGFSHHLGLAGHMRSHKKVAVAVG